MNSNIEFGSLIIVSCIVLVLIARYSLRTRRPNPMAMTTNILVVIFLVVTGMMIGKYGATWGLPWWLYYPIPMLLTVFFPLIYFKMSKKESLEYVILTLISGPVIHILFSLFGWKNYMPFIEIPAFREMIGGI